MTDLTTDLTIDLPVTLPDGAQVCLTYAQYDLLDTAQRHGVRCLRRIQEAGDQLEALGLVARERKGSSHLWKITDAGRDALAQLDRAAAEDAICASNVLHLPMPQTWIIGADRLALHVIGNTSGVQDVIRFRILNGQIVREYPHTAER